MTVSDFETTYGQLHEQMLRGELGEEEFKAEVEKLRFKDEHGTQWKIGWYTGKWYRFDNGQWVQDQPAMQSAEPALPPAQASPKRRSLAPCLVVSLIALLLVATIILIFDWNSNRRGEPDQDATAAALTEATSKASTKATAVAKTAEAAAPSPSEVSSAAASPRATATSASRSTPMPSRTSAATATRTSPTATSTARPTRTPQPSATLQATASQTPTARATTAPTAAAAKPTTSPGLSGRIYFPVYDANPDRRTFDIYVMRLDTGERDILIGQASEPALSPNGQRMAFRSWDSAQRGILVRELTDGNTWTWTNFHEAAHPSWSPNNQDITFASQQELDRRWRLYRTWGQAADRVRRDGGDIFGRVPIWSADGRIIYWECPIDKCGLYAIQDDGTHLSRLTGKEHDIAPAASPDGSQLAYMSSIDGNWEIFATTTRPPAGPEVPEPKRLTKNGARDGLPTWSPDGGWLAFVSDRDGAWAVYVMRPDGSGQQKLFDLDGSLEGEIANAPPTEQPGWTWETLAWGP